MPIGLIMHTVATGKLSIKFFFSDFRLKAAGQAIPFNRNFKSRSRLRPIESHQLIMFTKRFFLCKHCSSAPSTDACCQRNT